MTGKEIFRVLRMAAGLPVAFVGFGVLLVGVFVAYGYDAACEVWDAL